MSRRTKKHVMNKVAPSERGRETGGSDASSRNALKLGLRAKVRFPEEMAEKINVRADRFNEALVPETDIEEFLVREMARTTVQIDVCADLMLYDDQRVLHRVDTCWDHDRGEQAEK